MRYVSLILLLVGIILASTVVEDCAKMCIAVRDNSNACRTRCQQGYAGSKNNAPSSNRNYNDDSNAVASISKPVDVEIELMPEDEPAPPPRRAPPPPPAYRAPPPPVYRAPPPPPAKKAVKAIRR